MSNQSFPRLNEHLIAEVEYICRRANAVKYGRPDDRQLARQINEWGQQQGFAEGSYMSEEGFSGIMREGSEPRVETLRKAARYMRSLEPSYSIGRLFRAAGWYDEDDPERSPARAGPHLGPTQAQLCALLPAPEQDEAEALLLTAQVYLKKHPPPSA